MDAHDGKLSDDSLDFELQHLVRYMGWIRIFDIFYYTT